MSNNIFPYVNLDPFQEQQILVKKQDEFPELIEMDLDLETLKIKLNKGGNILLVYRDDALKVWIYKALRTVRYRYVAYTWNFGNEAEKLIGLPNTKELRESELERYTREALSISKYIKLLYNFSFEYTHDKIICNFFVDSIYSTGMVINFSV